MNNSSTKKQSISSSAKSKTMKEKKNNWHVDSSTKSNITAGQSMKKASTQIND